MTHDHETAPSISMICVAVLGLWALAHGLIENFFRLNNLWVIWFFPLGLLVMFLLIDCWVVVDPDEFEKKHPRLTFFRDELFADVVVWGYYITIIHAAVHFFSVLMPLITSVELSGSDERHVITNTVLLIYLSLTTASKWFGIFLRKNWA